MKNYLITTDDENIMVFCEDEFDIGLANIEKLARKAGVIPNDVVEVNEDMIQYYLYSPVWLLTEKARENVLNFIAKD